MAKYGLAFKDKVVARLLPPERASVEDAAQETRVNVGALKRWRSESLCNPARGRDCTAASRLDAALTTAALDETSRSAWCRENGLHPQELAAWRDATTQALADPQDVRATPEQTKADRRRIKELEREVRRKDRALAEMTALLVLSKNSRRSSTRERTNDRSRGALDDCPKHRRGSSGRCTVAPGLRDCRH